MREPPPNPSRRAKDGTVPVDDDSKQVRPGAAFGIPEGATGEEVVDAVFGQAGIDPELLPYLEAAGAPDPVSSTHL